MEDYRSIMRRNGLGSILGDDTSTSSSHNHDQNIHVDGMQQVTITDLQREEKATQSELKTLQARFKKVEQDFKQLDQIIYNNSCGNWLGNPDRIKEEYYQLQSQITELQTTLQKVQTGINELRTNPHAFKPR